VIAAVGVVVPTRNERDRILACLRSLRRALQRLPTGTAAAVTVVLDRCTDDQSDVRQSVCGSAGSAPGNGVRASTGEPSGSVLQVHDQLG
jgi:hypothetical protein